VQSALESVSGVEKAEVSMPNSAVVSGSADPTALIAAVKAAGFGASVR